jgi:hypothetical protein
VFSDRFLDENCNNSRKRAWKSNSNDEELMPLSRTAVNLILTADLLPLEEGQTDSLLPVWNLGHGALCLVASTISFYYLRLNEKLPIPGLSFLSVSLSGSRLSLIRFGPILCYRYGTLVMVPLCLIAPALSLLIAEDAGRYLGLMAVLIVRNIASTTAFTGVLLIVSNSSPPEDAGKVSRT